MSSQSRIRAEDFCVAALLSNFADMVSQTLKEVSVQTNYTPMTSHHEFTCETIGLLIEAAFALDISTAHNRAILQELLTRPQPPRDLP